MSSSFLVFLVLATGFASVDAARVRRHASARRLEVDDELTKRTQQCVIDGPLGSVFQYRFKVAKNCRAKCLSKKMTLHATVIPEFLHAVPDQKGKECKCFLHPPRGGSDTDQPFLNFRNQRFERCTGQICWEHFLHIENQGKEKHLMMGPAYANNMESQCVSCNGGDCPKPSGLYLNFDDQQIEALKESAKKEPTSTQLYIVRGMYFKVEDGKHTWSASNDTATTVTTTTVTTSTTTTTTTTTTLPQLELKPDVCSDKAWSEITRIQVATRKSKDRDHVYVKCPSDSSKRPDERKISCSESECGAGSSWCYVKPKCGGILIGKCKRKAVKSLPCWGSQEESINGIDYAFYEGKVNEK